MACYFNDKKVLPLADFSQTDSFDSRRTANGEKILSPSFALVEKIKGKTVKSTNLIPFPYLPKNDASNGIYYTSDDKGVITANGTLTSTNSSYIFARYVPIEIGKVYTLSSAATNNVYYMIQIYNNRGSWVHNIPNTEHDAVTFSVKYNGTQWEVEYSRGNGSPAYFYFDGAADSFTSGSYYFRIFVNLKGSVGDVVNNVKLYPMLNEGTTALPYTPYFAGLKNATISGIKSVGVNLIPYPYWQGAKTVNGITFTPNDDGSITLNGTATASANYQLYDYSQGKSLLGVGTYAWSAGAQPVTGLSMFATLWNKSEFIRNMVNAFSSNNYFNITQSDIDNGYTVGFNLYVTVGSTLNNVTVYPMLNYGSTPLPNSPYTENTYQLPESYELGEWDSINPIEKTVIRGTKTLIFDGTEKFYDYISGFGEVLTNTLQDFMANGIISNRFDTVKGNDRGGQIAFRVPKTSTLEEFVNEVKAMYAAENPLTVAYELLEPTTETAEDLPRGYTAHKDGTETYLAGETDNSEWGAIPEFTLNYPKIMKEGKFNG